MVIVYFLSWTFILYWIHRLGHHTPFIKQVHWNHHSYVTKNGMQGWHWNNLFLFNDTWTSTVDLYITEVIPTILFSWITGQWWIFMLYYVWAAIFQEIIEHNKKINIPFFTSGQWHLIPHRFPNKNYSLFFPLWDILFGTYKHVDKRK